MKTIVLSFDDARYDFFTRAFPILKKYSIPSTLNVISNFLSDNNQQSAISFPSSKLGMSKDNLLECYETGLVEVACPGANHLNTKQDVMDSIKELRSIGIRYPILGFASPNSVITEQNKNNDGVWDLIEEGELLYVRSGIQIRREGYLYSALSLIDRYIHSDFLYGYLNRHNIIDSPGILSKRIIPSVAVFSYTKRHQIESLIKRQRDSSTIILMFHSILNTKDEGYGADRYYWNADDFEMLCSFLKSQSDVKICMTRDLLL